MDVNDLAAEFIEYPHVAVETAAFLPGAGFARGRRDGWRLRKLEGNYEYGTVRNRVFVPDRNDRGTYILWCRNPLSSKRHTLKLCGEHWSPADNRLRPIYGVIVFPAGGADGEYRFGYTREYEEGVHDVRALPDGSLYFMPRDRSRYPDDYILRPWAT